MKYLFLSLLFFSILYSCSKSDDGNNQNPYLPNYGFDTQGLINTSLPAYSNLLLPGNFYVNYNFGINGFVLYHIGNGQYTCFELTDSNHTISTCSTLTVDDIFATCGCPDGNTYEIVTGQPTDGTEGQYTLKPYRIEVSGNIIRVYN